MRWYRPLYLSKNTADQIDKIREKAAAGAWVPGIYFVTLSSEPGHLLDLFHKGWDYNFRGNAFYGFHFLDEDLISFLAEKLPKLLQKYNIYLEDPSLVALKLSVAIMYYRIQNGHELSSAVPIVKENTGIYLACRELFE